MHRLITMVFVCFFSSCLACAQLSGMLDPKSIPAISSYTTWLSSFSFDTDAIVVFSSASHSAYSATSLRAANAAWQIPPAVLVSAEGIPLQNVWKRTMQSPPAFLDRGAYMHLDVNTSESCIDRILVLVCLIQVSLLLPLPLLPRPLLQRDCFKILARPSRRHSPPPWGLCFYEHPFQLILLLLLERYPYHNLRQMLSMLTFSCRWRHYNCRRRYPCGEL